MTANAQKEKKKKKTIALQHTQTRRGTWFINLIRKENGIERQRS